MIWSHLPIPLPRKEKVMLFFQFGEDTDFETKELDDGSNISYWRDDMGLFNIVIWAGDMPDFVAQAEMDFG